MHFYIFYLFLYLDLFIWSFWYNKIFKEWVSFFLGSLGLNRSAGQTNRVNREAVLGRFVCSALRFIPHEHRKKTLIPYIYNASNQGPFQKFSEKNYKFKSPTVTGSNFIWCINHCACDSVQMPNFLLTLFIGKWTEKI